MRIAKPSMDLLYNNGYDENICLSLLTANPSNVLGLEDAVGKLDIGMDADFLVCNGIPGLEVYEACDILSVFIKGCRVISR